MNLYKTKDFAIYMNKNVRKKILKVHLLFKYHINRVQGDREQKIIIIL